MITIMLAAALASATDVPAEDCIPTLSRTFEVSGEPAVDVALAVAVGCDQTFAPAPANSLLGAMSFERRKQASDEARRLIRDISLVLVMRLRACRKTPSCALSSVR